jgi:hypothetical protein
MCCMTSSRCSTLENVHRGDELQRIPASLQTAQQSSRPSSLTCCWVVRKQEWAAANSVALPVRDQRANTTSYYRFEEEVPTNILQVPETCATKYRS